VRNRALWSRVLTEPATILQQLGVVMFLFVIG
jgi:hypothetical protein